MKNEYLGEGVPPRYLKENNTWHIPHHLL
jgi:hypothetical protein